MNRINYIFILLVFISCKNTHIANLFLDQYNIVWESQSKDAGESMPLVGGDIGRNVWVENGDTVIEYFKNTYEFTPEHRKGNVKSWHQDGIQLARMGMTKEAAEYNVKKLQDSLHRFPTFRGPGHDWVPDHNWGGSGMIGLQEMLMQTIGDKILLFPTWPKEWNVDFKLHAPQNTDVEVVYQEGKVVKLNVTPKEREKDVVIRNN